MLTVFWCRLARSLPWEGSGQWNENFFNTSKITLWEMDELVRAQFSNRHQM